MPIHGELSATYYEGLVTVEEGGLTLRARKFYEDMDGNGTYLQGLRHIWTPPGNVAAVPNSTSQITVSWATAVPAAPNSLDSYRLADFTAISATLLLVGTGKYEVDVLPTKNGYTGGIDFYYRTSTTGNWIFEGSGNGRFVFTSQFTNGEYVEVLAIAKTLAGGRGFAAKLTGTAGSTSNMSLQTTLGGDVQALVYRSTTSSFAGATLVHTTTGTQFVDTGRATGTQYWYWVRNRFHGIDGPLSGAVSATTHSPTPALSLVVFITQWNSLKTWAESWARFSTNADVESVDFRSRVNGGVWSAWAAVNVSPSSTGQTTGQLITNGGETIDFQIRPYSGDGATGTVGSTYSTSGTAATGGAS